MFDNTFDSAKRRASIKSLKKILSEVFVTSVRGLLQKRYVSNCTFINAQVHSFDMQKYANEYEYELKTY